MAWLEQQILQRVSVVALAPAVKLIPRILRVISHSFILESVGKIQRGNLEKRACLYKIADFLSSRAFSAGIVASGQWLVARKYKLLPSASHLPLATNHFFVRVIRVIRD